MAHRCFYCSTEVFEIEGEIPFTCAPCFEAEQAEREAAEALQKEILAEEEAGKCRNLWTPKPGSLVDYLPVTMDCDDLFIPASLRQPVNPAYQCDDWHCTHECNQMPF